MNEIVIDTHIWIWLMNGDPRIEAAGYLDVIEEAASHSKVRISAITPWEVSMLSAKGRINLTENTLDWIRNSLKAPGILLEPLSPEISVESANLPGGFHGDSADRMIVATCRIKDATLLTFDTKIIEYASKGYLKILKPAV